MIKTAYDYGAYRALLDYGLVKQADDNATLVDADHNAETPAEQLAQLFKQHAEEAGHKPKLAPDNKTREDEAKDGNDPHWGAPAHGNGQEALMRNAPGAAPIAIGGAV